MEDKLFEAEKEFNEALSKAQGEMDVAISDRSGHKNDYCSYKSLEKAAGPALRKYGFSVVFKPRFQDGMWMYSAVLKHLSGHSEESVFPFIPNDSGSMSLIQGWGASGTYMQRYTYRYVTGVITSDEVDPDDYESTPKTQTKNMNLSDDHLDKLEKFIETNAPSPAAFIKEQLAFYKIPTLRHLTEKKAHAMMNHLRNKN